MKKLVVTLSIILLPALHFAQCPGAAVSFTVDLSASVDTVWTSPSTARNGYACAGTGTDKCISFVVTINPLTTVLNFNIATGALPGGALAYEVNCGADIPLGQKSCVSGLTSFCISFCKPGNATNTYSISLSKAYVNKPDTIIRQNCSKLITVSNLSEPSLTWNSIAPGAPGQYNSYLSCTSGCDSVNIAPTFGAPAYVDYKISGNDLVCGLPVSDTIRVFIDPPMSVSLSPTNGFICTGGSPPVTLTATPTGGSGPYAYLWSPGLETTSSISASSAGTYTVSVTDAISGCPAETQTVTVASTITPAS
ncbi:MAG: hypothetical protein ACJ76F_14455, partial [Bacteroidia bacterium]